MSYNTIEEAMRYIEAYKLSSDNSRFLWEGLDEEDQQVLLNQAFQIIESLPLTGRKTVLGQPNAFPRWPYQEVPEAVRHAEVELALSLADTDASDAVKNYRQMIDYGISSYSVGNFSETLLTYNKNSMPMQYGLISAEAERLLSPWMSGGFRVCPACRSF